MTTKRFLIGHRHGARLEPVARQALDTFLAARRDAVLVRRTPAGRHVLEMTEERRRELATSNPELVLEEDAELQPGGPPGLPPTVACSGEYALHVVVSDATTGQPVPNVALYGITSGVAYRAITGEGGTATLLSGTATLERVIAMPLDTYWSRVLPDIKIGDKEPLAIRLKSLLAMGAYDWGRRLMGFGEIDPRWQGRGIRIGIIDSGLSDHPALQPAEGYNALARADPTSWRNDEHGRGTHVAGLIAGQSVHAGAHGAAPGAQVYPVKAWPGGRLSDLVAAVEWCIIQRMDVINISLGTSWSSHLLASVLQDAHDRGITCVAAAGDAATHVPEPAALPAVLAVAALGRRYTFPEDSFHALQASRFTGRQGGQFAARFTNFGTEIDLCAPGVAMLSAAPGGYAALDGTAASCALVSALVALILEAYPSWRTGDAQQPGYIRSLLRHTAADLGMPSLLQGHGLPLASRALAAARSTAYAAR